MYAQVDDIKLLWVLVQHLGELSFMDTACYYGEHVFHYDERDCLRENEMRLKSERSMVRAIFGVQIGDRKIIADLYLMLGWQPVYIVWPCIEGEGWLCLANGIIVEDYRKGSSNETCKSKMEQDCMKVGMSEMGAVCFS